jgi:hypothetical protein
MVPCTGERTSVRGVQLLLRGDELDLELGEILGGLGAERRLALFQAFLRLGDGGFSARPGHRGGVDVGLDVVDRPLEPQQIDL